MRKYLSKKAIDFAIPFLDEQGESISVAKVLWEVLDEKESSIAAGEITPAVDDTQVVIELGSEICTISNGQNTEVRLLKITLVAQESEVSIREYFTLENEQTVTPAENSFVTYLEALRLMPEFPQFVAFNTATEQERKAALIAAYRNIGNIEFAKGALIDNEGSPMLTDSGDSFWTTLQITPELYDVLDKSVKQNLEFAQMVEAEYILGGDGTEDLRSKGVLSYSVGEVKQFFRTSKPLELSVSKHALKYIGRYVQYDRRLTRV
ncbi:TPA: hypothetical protein ACPJ1H_004021 [Vibrio alginolyticus]